MTTGRIDGPPPSSEVPGTRALRQVRAAQLRAKALKWAIGKSAFGTIFLVGALAYALAPQRHSELSHLWMAFLLVLSTLNVGLGLRTFSRVRRRAARYWPVATALWGVLATALVRLLMQR